ncbi:MAG TPA: O-antigen ligase family protein [Candidatus Paceibacterota bacterium]
MYSPIVVEKRMPAFLKWGLFLLLPLPLYTSSLMLFPFITGRNFGFRILVELLVIVWAGLLILSREYRPQLTWLTRSVILFLFVVTLADILGANPYRSFWSNYERMEGLLMILHVVLFYLLVTTAFRRFQDWKWYFLGSTAVSVIVSFFGLSQKLGLTRVFQGGEGRSIRVDGTIGNPTYLASYLMFHIFFLLFFIWRERNAYLRWGAGAVVLFELMIIYFTATRGVILAIIGVAGFMGLAFVFRRPQDTREVILRKIAIGTLAVGIAVVGLFFAFRNNDIVKKNPTLARFTSISVGERTVQSRFLIWQMAWQGVKERPVLGWGQENFYLIFNKYYNPQLWSSEPWFDRSHNVFLDWLVHTGFLGLAAYLMILFFGLKNVWTAFKRQRIVFYEAGILAGLFGVYFFQNLFVFDNFQSYFLLFLTLGFTDYLAESGKEPERAHIPITGRSVNSNMAFWGMGIIAVPIVIWLYYGSYLPIQASKSLIQSLSIARVESKAPVGAIRDSFKKTMDYETFGSGEAREQLVGLMRSIVADPNRGTPEELKNFAVYAIDEAQKLTAGDAPDAKHFLFLGSAYNTAASLDPIYGGKALEALQRAVALAPKKQPMYFELATTELSLGNREAALRAMEEAVRLDPSFPTAHLNAGLVAAYAGNANLVASELAEFRKLTAVPDEASFERMIAAYSQVGDFQDIKSLIEEAIQREPVNALLYGRYAAILATVGDVKGARDAAIKAGELDPKLQPQVGQFLKELDDRAKGIIPKAAP